MDKTAAAVGNRLPAMKTSMTMQHGVQRIATYLVLVLMSLLFLTPFLFMIGTAFKRYDDIVGDPINPIPFHPTWELRYLEAAKTAQPALSVSSKEGLANG